MITSNPEMGLVNVNISEELMRPSLPYRIKVNRGKASNFFNYFGVSKSKISDIDLNFYRYSEERPEANAHYYRGTLSFYCDQIWGDPPANRTFLHEARHCLDDFGDPRLLESYHSSSSYPAIHYREIAKAMAKAGLVVGCGGVGASILLTQNEATGALSVVAGIAIALAGITLNKIYGEFDAHYFAEKLDAFNTWQDIITLQPSSVLNQHQINN